MSKKTKYPNDGGLKQPVRSFEESLSVFDVLNDQYNEVEKNSGRFDLLVFVGRFQPFHVEHKRTIDEALKRADNVLILVGSSGKARTTRNPFTYEERVQMISNCYSDDLIVGSKRRIHFQPLYDKTYNDSAWVKQVQDVVKKTALEIANKGGFPNHGTADIKIGLIGASKDHTSYYLSLFPQWGSVDVGIVNELHATYIREGYLEGRFQKHEIITNEVPTAVAKFLFDEFLYTDDYMNLRRELEHVRDYKKQWEAAPYPVKHVTCDVVIEQSGHVLLIRRRAVPGLRLWAMPGGHLEIHETLEDGCIRELMEETKIKVPEKVLRGNIVARQVFDDPHRSQIGRVITYAIHIKLPDDKELPKVKGSDDADKAKWVPISELREDQLFDDHYHILCTMLGI